MNELHHFFGDDTTTVTTPHDYTVKKSPSDQQVPYQDTISFTLQHPEQNIEIEMTASHFSSGNRQNNLEKFKTIIAQKKQSAQCPQVVMGDINTEIKTLTDLQALADEMQMVIIIPALKVRRVRGLQDQLHKRMEKKDEYDSMFIAIDPMLVDQDRLVDIKDQNYAWPYDESKGFWKLHTIQDIAQAWMDERILTDHAVVQCPLLHASTISLANAARANYEKYNIKNQAQIGRRTYLEGQEIIECCVVAVTMEFISELPVSSTLSIQHKNHILEQLSLYQNALPQYYQNAYQVWDDEDDLCSDQTPLGIAMKALGTHSKRFVESTRQLAWEDIRDVPHLRDKLKEQLSDMLIEKLGVGSKDSHKPLAHYEVFDPHTFKMKSYAKIEAAWERIIKRQSAGDLYKLWFAELLQGQTTGGMPIPHEVLSQDTRVYINQRLGELGLADGICVVVEALR